MNALADPAVARVLADFQAWLPPLLAAPASGPNTPAEEGEPLDLFTLLSQMVALRQEVNLQTRATRAQQEQNSETLRQLTLALESLRQSQAGARQAQQHTQEDSLRPLLKTLVDLYDALALAGREMARAQETVLPSLDQVVRASEPLGEIPPEETPAPAPPPRPRWWARWLSPTPAPAAERDVLREKEAADRRERARQVREGVERVRHLLSALVTGYTMSLQRLERALGQHGLEPIPARGREFDPERMEVVEAVEGSGRAAGTVLDEVRRGYLWNGRVFRFAQVRVARS